MELHNLSPAFGSTKKEKRLGRGIGSGHGKTSCKGHKGQWARSGGGVRPGFEGGQMPLTRKIPKRGFTNIFKKEYNVVNVQELNGFEAGTVIDVALLKQSGVITKIAPYGLKILGKGDIDKAITVKVSSISESAKAKIEAKGGKVEVLECGKQS